MTALFGEGDSDGILLLRKKLRRMRLAVPPKADGSPPSGCKTAGFVVEYDREIQTEPEEPL